MDRPARNPLRFLAPVALIAAALLFLVVIAGAIGGGGEESASTEPTGQTERRGGDGSGDRGNRNAPETYEVQEGDTLDSIAADTGVSVEEIQELNPDLDPQSLIAGQELQLSE
jgi:LysM domain